MMTLWPNSVGILWMTKNNISSISKLFFQFRSLHTFSLYQPHDKQLRSVWAVSWRGIGYEVGMSTRQWPLKTGRPITLCDTPATAKQLQCATFQCHPFLVSPYDLVSLHPGMEYPRGAITLCQSHRFPMETNRCEDKDSKRTHRQSGIWRLSVDKQLFLSESIFASC